MKNILITGITGQDGLFLSKLLLENTDFNIFGITRKKSSKQFFENLKLIEIDNFSRLNVLNCNLNSSYEVKKLLVELNPTQIYNLTGPSSVYQSLIDNNQTKNEIINIFNNLVFTLLERDIKPDFFQASSSEMFGPNNSEILDENSNFIPNSPYAEAKLDIHQNISQFANQHNWNIKSGIMFNHESEFRDRNYLFNKIISSAYQIYNGNLNIVKIGSLEYSRDWTFAGDMMSAAYQIINYGSKESYVIGSGKSHTIKYLIENVFEFFGLNWEQFIEVDEGLLRKNDPKEIVCNPSRIQNELNWKPEMTFEDLVYRCVTKFCDKF